MWPNTNTGRTLVRDSNIESVECVFKITKSKISVWARTVVKCHVFHLGLGSKNFICHDIFVCF